MFLPGSKHSNIVVVICIVVEPFTRTVRVGHRPTVSVQCLYVLLSYLLQIFWIYIVNELGLLFSREILRCQKLEHFRIAVVVPTKLVLNCLRNARELDAVYIEF